MKKVVIIAALAFVSLANAQKGSVLVAGNIGYESKSKGDTKSNYFEFAPKVGYQFTENMTVGIESEIGSATNSNVVANVKSEYNLDTFKIGSFLRYSKPLAGVFSVFGDLGVGFQSAKTSNNLPLSSPDKATGFYIGFVPAVGVDLKKGFCLNFSIGGLGFDSMKVKGASDATNTFAFTFGKQASVGISKNF
jgi:hypothetical protein